ncbi:elongation factor P 5-aminopentanone reductase [Diplocloster modestus]|uniref:SDR family oxidoreductase n=1 Tax=Diplocloster modestus TaxID=2850322 RepID=A0ABS6KDQ9_9FIRM|nr:SDR family oxidoreductase [Diplocloster modestus]MBU9728656.1 SDR family oxidoreductase [Diplocloster modestus]
MGQTVLVTGSSRGIGRAIALKFAVEGWSVVLNCARSLDRLQDVRHEIEERTGQACLVCPGDVGNYEQALGIFSEIERRLGGVDLLVNNAGVSHIGLLQDMSADEWQDLLNTNLSSVFYCSKLAVPYMLSKKKGRIINISSVWGNVGASCEVAYSASKGGVNALTRALAKELAPSNIQVNAVACGAIETEMNQFLSASERQELMEEIPAGRCGDPQEVAQMVYQLALAPSYLTGQVITLDGGWI